MNVMGISYDHKCPKCDPNKKHYARNLLHSMGRMPHDNPTFGPTRKTILEGGELAMEISESKRLFSAEQKVMTQEQQGSYRGPIRTGVVSKLEKSSWPGMRWYRVDIEEQSKHTYEEEIAPFRKFADGEGVLVKHNNDWIPANIVKLVNKESDHFLYRQHWYEIDVIATSTVHNSIFDGKVKEKDIKPGFNPDCRYCKGSGKVTLATTSKECLDCWPL